MILSTITLFIVFLIFITFPSINFKFKTSHIKPRFIKFKFFIIYLLVLIFFLYSLINFHKFSITNIFYNSLNYRYYLSNHGNSILYFIFVNILINLPFFYYSLCITFYRFNLFMFFSFCFIIILISFCFGSKGVVLMAVFNIIVFLFMFKKSYYYTIIFVSSLSIVLLCFIFIEKGLIHTEYGITNGVMISVYARMDMLRNFDFFLSSYMENKIHPDYLYSLKNFFFQYIPRSLYSEKPYMFNPHITKLIQSHVFHNNVTYNFGSISECIYNFGIYFFFIYSTLAGILLKAFNDLFFKHGKIFKYCIFYFFFSYLPFNLFSSGLYNTTFIFTPIIAILILFVYTFFFRFNKFNNGN